MRENTIPKQEIKITTRGFKVTEGIQEKVHNKIVPLNKFVKGSKNVKVNLKKDKAGSTATIMVSIGKKFIKVQSTSGDLYKSIDNASQKLKNQMSKLSKASERSQRRHSIRYSHFDYPSQRVQLEEVFGEILPYELKEQTHRYSIGKEPMTEEEAFKALVKSKKQYFIYVDEESFEQSYVTA